MLVKVLAELKRQWRTDNEAMGEIYAAAEVEEMLTPALCESFAFARPATAEEALHVETLYLSDEFGRDGWGSLVPTISTVGKRGYNRVYPPRLRAERAMRDEADNGDDHDDSEEGVEDGSSARE